MAFRADEAASRGLEKAKSYLIPRHASAKERERGEAIILDIIGNYGPVIDSYPSWHPIVAQYDGRNPERLPSERCGYRGLDHTIHFANGFITCPYSDGSSVIESTSKINTAHCAHLEAEELDITFYNSGTKAIFVRCEWNKPLDANNLIPKSLAVPLMLEKEMPVWRWSECAETWENMRPYLLGDPHGNRSSLFVSQDTALAMKKAYLAMIESGMFGPIN